MPTESVPPVPDPKITVAVTTNRARKFLFLVRESKLAAMRARVPDLMASVQRHWTKPTFKIRLQPSCDPVRYDSPNRGNNSTL